MPGFDFEDAIPLLESGLKIAPQRADLHAALGESYFMSGKAEKAIDDDRLAKFVSVVTGSIARPDLNRERRGKTRRIRKIFVLPG